MGKHIKRDPRVRTGAAGSGESDAPDLEDILAEFDSRVGLEDAPDEPTPEAPEAEVPAPAPEAEPAAEKTPDAFPFEEDLSDFFTAEESAAEPAPAAEEPPSAPAATMTKTEPAPVKRPAPRKKPAQAQRKKSPARGKKRKKSRRKKKDHFKTGLIVYMILLGLIIIGLLVTLWIGLERSQQRIDEENAEIARQRAEQAAQRAHEREVYRAPQLAFESWLANADAEYWTELWYQGKEGDLDGRDRVKAYFAELFTPAEAFKSLDYTAEKPSYVLKNGDARLAVITLSGSDVNWNVSDVQLLVEGKEKASVRVASGSRVYCNGVALGEDYIVDSSSYFTYEPLRDTLVNPVTWNTYEVSGLLLEPTLTADPPEGGVVTETAEGDFLLCLDEAAGKTYQTRAVNFVKTYLYYFMSGYNGTWGNLYAALAYLTPGYQAYKDLQDTYNGVVWNTAYANIDTSRTTAGDAVIWADNCYSVDVTYDAKCTLNGQPIDYEAATLRIYFLKTNAGYIISNFETL